MRLLCRWVERSIAISIARDTEISSPWMRRHVARCPQCACAVAEMRAVRDALPAALDAPETSDAFVTGVWAAVTIAASEPIRERRMPAAAWAAALTAVVLLTVVLVPQARRSHPSPVVVEQTRTGEHTETGQSASAVAPAAAAYKSDRTDPSRSAVGAQASPRTTDDRRASERDTAAERAAIRRMLRLRQRMAGGSPRTAPPRSAQNPAPLPASPEPDRAATTMGWVELAHYYEAQSDVASAAYAYRQALRERQDPDTAFAAGRTSEAAGDILSAVECFAELLDRGPAAGSSNEGASLTKPDRRLADCGTPIAARPQTSLSET